MAKQILDAVMLPSENDFCQSFSRSTITQNELNEALETLVMFAKLSPEDTISRLKHLIQFGASVVHTNHKKRNTLQNVLLLPHTSLKIIRAIVEMCPEESVAHLIDNNDYENQNSLELAIKFQSIEVFEQLLDTRLSALPRMKLVNLLMPVESPDTVGDDACTRMSLPVTAAQKSNDNFLEYCRIFIVALEKNQRQEKDAHPQDVGLHFEHENERKKLNNHLFKCATKHFNRYCTKMVVQSEMDISYEIWDNSNHLYISKTRVSLESDAGRKQDLIHMKASSFFDYFYTNSNLMQDHLDRTLHQLLEATPLATDIIPKLKCLLSLGACLISISSIENNALHTALKNKAIPIDAIDLIVNKCPAWGIADLIDTNETDDNNSLELAIMNRSCDVFEKLLFARLSVEPRLNYYSVMLPHEYLNSDPDGRLLKQSLIITAAHWSKQDHICLQYFRSFLNGLKIYQKECPFKCQILRTEETEEYKEITGYAFRCAVEKRYVKCIKCMLDAGVDVDVRFHSKFNSGLSNLMDNRKTALEKELKRLTVDKEIVELLLDYGADVQTFFIRSIALRRVISWDKGSLLQLLLSHDTHNLLVSSFKDYEILFKYSAMHDSLDCLKFLLSLSLQNGATKDFLYEKLSIVFHIAAARKRSECLHYLLEDHFKFKDKNGNDAWSETHGTPLHVASRRMCYQNMNVLLAHNANMYRHDVVGKTPLMIIIRNCIENIPKRTVPALLAILRAGCEVDLCDSKVFNETRGIWLRDESCLQVAVGHRLLPVAYMLFEAGATPNFKVFWFKHSGIREGKHYLYSKAQMEDFIENVLHQPRSLLSIARNKIRAYYGYRPNISSFFEQLDIPDTLKDYLNLADLDYLKEKYRRDYSKMMKTYLAKANDGDEDICSDEGGLVGEEKENPEDFREDECWDSDVESSLNDLVIRSDIYDDSSSDDE